MTDTLTLNCWPGRGLAHVEGRHSVSPFNFRPEVTQEFDFPKPLALIDSTIRKVIYTAGVRSGRPASCSRSARSSKRSASGTKA